MSAIRHPEPAIVSEVADICVLYICPSCQGPLFWAVGQYDCPACAFDFPLRQTPVRRNQPDFRLPADRLQAPALDETEAWQNRIKMRLRRYPALYRALVYLISPVLLLGPSSQKFVTDLGPQARVLSIGAGVMRLKGQVTHLDFEPYPHLEVVGDAHCLPFPENSFDGVVCETMLEHVPEPDRVIAEMRRVLKPGGKVFIMMPFMYPFHAAPNDFSRLTHRGLQVRMRGFDEELLKVVCGPTSALNGILGEWLAMVFSLGSRSLYQILSLFFMVLLSPLKICDFLLSYHPEAVRSASVYLYIGRKRIFY